MEKLDLFRLAIVISLLSLGLAFSGFWLIGRINL